MLKIWHGSCRAAALESTLDVGSRGFPLLGAAGGDPRDAPLPTARDSCSSLPEVLGKARVQLSVINVSFIRSRLSLTMPDRAMDDTLSAVLLAAGRVLVWIITNDIHHTLTTPTHTFDKVRHASCKGLVTRGNTDCRVSS